MSPLEPFDPQQLLTELAKSHAALATLKEHVVSLEQVKRELSHQIELKDTRIGVLEYEAFTRSIELSELKKMVFGKRSEREVEHIPVSAMPLFRDKAIPEVPEPENCGSLIKEHTRKARKKIPRTREHKFPDHLPQVHRYPEHELTLCPCCESPQDHFVKYATTQKLGYYGNPFYVINYHRPIQTCKHCETVAPLTPLDAPLERSCFHETTVAGVVAEKCTLGTSIYRQAQRMQLNDIEISPEHLYQTTLSVALMFKPIATAIKRSILGGVFLADVTHISGKVKNKETHKERYKRCNLFSMMGVQKEIYYEYTESLTNETFLDVYDGVVFPLTSDAAAGFINLCGNAGVPQALCNYHARRRFKKSHSYNKQRALEALSFYRELSQIEKAIAHLCPADKMQARQKDAAPILQKFKIWCEYYYEREPKSTPLASAIGYVLRNWTGLTYYLHDGRVPFHTNNIEQMFRDIARGRRSFFHVSSLQGGQALAIFYTLVQSCQLRGIDPFYYLADVMNLISEVSDVTLLIPRNWKQWRLEHAKEKFGPRALVSHAEPEKKLIIVNSDNTPYMEVLLETA